MPTLKATKNLLHMTFLQEEFVFQQSHQRNTTTRFRIAQRNAQVRRFVYSPYVLPTHIHLFLASKKTMPEDSHSHILLEALNIHNYAITSCLGMAIVVEVCGLLREPGSLLSSSTLS